MACNHDEGPRPADGACSHLQSDTKHVDPVAGKTVAEILGEIVWLMTQDPAGREMKVAEIESLVMPAILARRFHIKYAQVPDMRRPGASTMQPVAVELLQRSGAEHPEKLAFPFGQKLRMRDITWRASFIAAIIAALIFLDQYAAGKADEKVMSENAYFDIALAKSQLDIRGPQRQNCRIGRVFFFYQYQTCFILSEDNGAAGGPGFDFIYHQPLPLLYFEQFSEDSYYFNEPSLGVRLATLNANNDVVYSRK